MIVSVTYINSVFHIPVSTIIAQYYFIVITIWIYYNTLFSSSKKTYEILRK